MQKGIVGGVVAWLFVVAGSISLVYSQPAALTGASETSTLRLGRDLSLTLGLDVWPNQWVKGFTTFPTGGSNVGQVSAFGVGFIPNATLTYQRFFLSASYMITPDYHFGQISTVNAPCGVGVIPSCMGVTGPLLGPATLEATRTTASRQEGDLTIGYFPLDWLGVAIGYKGIFQRFDDTNVNLVTVGNVVAGQDLGSGVS